MDVTDRKILYELDVNCRTPISKIAKKIRVGRDVAAYRIRKLESRGIITKYICSVNLGMLGYKTYKIYFKICNLKIKDRNQTSLLHSYTFLNNTLFELHNYLVTPEYVSMVGSQ